MHFRQSFVWCWIGCFLGIPVLLLGQTAKKDSSSIVFIQDKKITDLLTLYAALVEKKNGKVKGYRVQIHFGADRDKAKEVKAKFMQKYADQLAYEVYDSPNFKIRVGDFRTRLDAFRFLKQINLDFPSSFIVQDDVEIKEFNNK